MRGTGTETNTSIPGSGAVYVFERHTGVWVQSAYLKSATHAAEAYFGSALALKGDMLVVGALGESPQLPYSGAVYIFRRRGGLWILDAHRTAPDAEAGDRFGTAVALGPRFMAVGAPGESSDSTGIDGDSNNNRAPGSGAVFLIEH